ncbi:hypothetical protein HAX54_004102 [Datura stramonium]|uniref:Uncharacterized protein n=1 Tax=Datura stramonium TaxID=4076 RepID=A0ABS8T8S6_DATST|nr:hypothetical protein [Datura stramonium]
MEECRAVVLKLQLRDPPIEDIKINLSIVDSTRQLIGLLGSPFRALVAIESSLPALPPKDSPIKTTPVRALSPSLLLPRGLTPSRAPDIRDAKFESLAFVRIWPHIDSEANTSTVPRLTTPVFVPDFILHDPA